MLNALFDEERRRELRDSIKSGEPIVFRRQKPAAEQIEYDTTPIHEHIRRAQEIRSWENTTPDPSLAPDGGPNAPEPFYKYRIDGVM